MNSDLMTMNADGTNPVVVLNEVNYAYAFVFTPDGKAILANIWGTLYLVDFDGTRKLVSTLNVFDPTFSADGTKIFFNSLFDFSSWPPQLPTVQLFVMNADGTNVQQLTFDGLNYGPLVVDKRVMFVSDRAAPLVSIYSMEEDGTGVRAVTNSPQWDGFDSVLWWNPDNRGD
jgi:Tol biopolymer transport system component